MHSLNPILSQPPMDSGPECMMTFRMWISHDFGFQDVARDSTLRANLGPLFHNSNH